MRLAVHNFTTISTVRKLRLKCHGPLKVTRSRLLLSVITDEFNSFFKGQKAKVGKNVRYKPYEEGTVGKYSGISDDRMTP